MKDLACVPDHCYTGHNFQISFSVMDALSFLNDEESGIG